MKKTINIVDLCDPLQEPSDEYLSQIMEGFLDTVLAGREEIKRKTGLDDIALDEWREKFGKILCGDCPKNRVNCWGGCPVVQPISQNDEKLIEKFRSGEISYTQLRNLTQFHNLQIWDYLRENGFNRASGIHPGDQEPEGLAFVKFFTSLPDYK